MSADFHVGDYGQSAALTLTVVDQDGVIVSVAGATSITLKFTSPAGVAKVATPSLVTDGTDGKLHYAFAASDLDTAGTWQVQLLVVWVGGQNHTQKFSLNVLPNLGP